MAKEESSTKVIERQTLDFRLHEGLNTTQTRIELSKDNFPALLLVASMEDGKAVYEVIREEKDKVSIFIKNLEGEVNVIKSPQLKANGYKGKFLECSVSDRILVFTKWKEVSLTAEVQTAFKNCPQGNAIAALDRLQKVLKNEDGTAYLYWLRVLDDGQLAVSLAPVHSDDSYFTSIKIATHSIATTGKTNSKKISFPTLWEGHHQQYLKNTGWAALTLGIAGGAISGFLCLFAMSKITALLTFIGLASIVGSGVGVALFIIGCAVACAVIAGLFGAALLMDLALSSYLKSRDINYQLLDNADSHSSTSQDTLIGGQPSTSSTLISETSKESTMDIPPPSSEEKNISTRNSGDELTDQPSPDGSTSSGKSSISGNSSAHFQAVEKNVSGGTPPHGEEENSSPRSRSPSRGSENTPL